MRHYLILFTLLLCTFTPTAFSEEDEKSIAYKHAETIFKNEQYRMVKSSPSGDKVSFVEHKDGSQSLLLLDLHSGNMQILLNDNENALANYHWVDDDTLVISVRFNTFSQSLTKFDLIYKDGKIVDIDKKHLVDHAYVIDPLPRQKDRFLMKLYTEEKAYVYNIDLAARTISSQLKGKLKLNRLAPESNDWLTDRQANIRVGFGFSEDGKHKVWHKAKKKWDLVWDKDDDIKFTPVLYNEDKQEMYVISDYERNFSELLIYDLTQKKFFKTAFKIAGQDITHVELNKNGDEFLFAEYTANGVTNRRYFSELGSYLKNSLKKTVKTRDIWVIDTSLDNELVIALKHNSKEPGVFYLFDTKKWQLSELAKSSPWLDQFQMGSTQVIQSTSSDGLKIESYLTLPANHDTVKPPLIVMPHGGPVSVRSYLYFDRHVQYLATLGYAVLRPNYRGSSGYGKSFKLAAKQQWGKLIEDDIDSAVRQVQSMEVVENDKICIYGSSYGGYSALMSAIRAPSIYKCAASYVGVTDLSLMYNNDEHNFDEDVLKWRKEYVGDPITQLEDLMKHSPVYQASRINVPVFLAQGGKDLRVDKEHYFRMKETLKALGKKADYLLIEKEGHGFKYLDSHYKLYSRLDMFFRKHMDLPAASVLLK